MGYFAAGQVGQGSGACQQLLQFLLLFGDLHAQVGALGFLFHGLGAFLGGCRAGKSLGVIAVYIGAVHDIIHQQMQLVIDAVHGVFQPLGV